MRVLLVKILLRFCALMPLRVDHAIGALIGSLLAWLPNPLRRVSERNLDLCLPELPAAERRRLLRQSLVETARTALETGPLWLWPADRIRPLIVEETGTEAIDAARAAGRGVLLAAPHLGSWELAGHFAAWRWGVTSLYRPPRLAGLEDLMCRGREHLGARLVPTDAHGVRSLYQTLREGGVVAILPDQEPGSGGGVFAPFFGIEAWTMLLLSRLARKTGAAVFFGYCERLPGGRYRMRFHPAPPDIADADPRTAASALNRGVAACVRECPAQYAWSYRRFRTRPPGEPPLYE
ncbi:lysophospholipid acyltransferase family protein [Thiohalobacter sp.]|uniref:lysophospholipid acyltransferase family protein n=1 Tax=Thiohalobacter sp. TaxID=2025948 RepID=UPI0026347FE3|nr:lysophospholipid acyltransferase family protein [Thiohalobacter sp.]